MLTAKELEAMLKIDVKTIYSYVQRGLIPYVRIQSNLRFSKPEIQAWIEGTKLEMAEKPRSLNDSSRRERSEGEGQEGGKRSVQEKRRRERDAGSSRFRPLEMG